MATKKKAKKDGGPKKYIVGMDDPMFYEQSSMTFDDAVEQATEDAQESHYGDVGEVTTRDIYEVKKVASVSYGTVATVTMEKMKD